MLHLMRKHATSWIIKVFMAVIAIVFVFWGVGSYREQRASRFASVNGDLISAEEVQRMYQALLERMRRQFRGNLTPELLKALDLERQAVDQLIQMRLVRQEAKRLKLEVTDEEVREKIEAVSYFQRDGRFDPDQYFRVLAASRVQPAEFELEQRRALLAEKLRDVIGGMVLVSESEAFAKFQYEQEKADIEVVAFDSEQYLDSAEPKPEEIESYFEEHRNDYQEPERAKIGYVYYREGDFAKQVKILPGEIQSYYDLHPEEFRNEEEVHARHILFKVPEDATPEQEEKIREKAAKVLDMARNPKSDFESLARTYSEGPTNVKGGDLGFFRRGTMVKPFEDVAFRMKPGEISDLVRTRFGYHIIKVEEVREAGTQTLDEAKAAIEEKLRTEQAKDLAYEAVEQDIDDILKGGTLKQVAESKGRVYKESPYFDQSQTVAGLERVPDLVSTAFALDPGEMGPKIEVDDGYLLFTLLDKTAPQAPTLDKVRDRVVQDMKKEMAKKKAEEAARDFIRTVTGGADFAETAKSLNLEITKVANVERRGGVGAFGYNALINETVFTLDAPGDVGAEPVPDDGKFLVVRLVAMKVPDRAEFDKIKEDFMSGVLSQKKEDLFSKWLQDIKDQSEIVMYQNI